jgi:hypothetical protein
VESAYDVVVVGSGFGRVTACRMAEPAPAAVSPARSFIIHGVPEGRRRLLGRLNSSGVFESPVTERVGISAARLSP